MTPMPAFTDAAQTSRSNFAKKLSVRAPNCYGRETDEEVMQSAKHWAALGILGVFGALIAAGAKKPADQRGANTVPPVEREHMAIVAAHVVSASDVCVRANAPDPMIIDAASLQALRDACERATKDQAQALDFRDDDWEIVHPGTEDAEPVRRKIVGNPRVARRPALGSDEPAQRNR
ncbi:MAG TPA: hypothetical protein PK156_40055 [Polyangium sp.]|nr:hypothetical protein [Polyangium sp.]